MGDDNPAWHRQSQTAKEFSAQENEVIHEEDSVTVAADSSENLVLHANNSGNTQLLELSTIAQANGYTELLRVLITVRDSGGTTVFTFAGNAPNYPVALDPALPIPAGGDVFSAIDNNASSSITVSISLIMRQL